LRRSGRSRRVAWAMAQGALARSRADTVVAITGIAGPMEEARKSRLGR
jgi:nicotinamide mononucleotide (NMN) deamidase PncC